MQKPLKNVYNYDSIHQLALKFQTVYNTFPVEHFVNSVIDKTWNQLELKARVRQISLNLGKYLPNNYEQALDIVDQVVDSYPNGINYLFLLCLPDFVEVYGQDECHWDLSMKALAKYTQYSTSEFAVRPFIIKDEKRMMQQMEIWSKHQNEHLRRLASEGCRPQLPWGQVLTSFKQNPFPILKILEQLKNDSSLYVRKSVANNLNDISKTHPHLVIEIAQKWYGQNKNTDWIIKHACRTLLKQGNKNVLKLFGFTDPSYLHINKFSLNTNNIAIGQNLIFSFEIQAKKSSKIRLEYGIYYIKANGKKNRKIFQISELFLKEKQNKNYIKKHSFKNNSTRKHYSRIHSITLIVNGIEKNTFNFELSY